MKVYVITITSEEANGLTCPGSFIADLFFDKDKAIAEVKSLVEGQKRIEGSAMVDFPSVYDGKAMVFIPGLKMEGVPVFAIRTRTKSETAHIDAYTWRAVFEKEIKE